MPVFIFLIVLASACSLMLIKSSKCRIHILLVILMRRHSVFYHVGLLIFTFLTFIPNGHGVSYIQRQMYQFPSSAIIKSHKLSDLKKKLIFSVLEARIVRMSSCQEDHSLSKVWVRISFMLFLSTFGVASNPWYSLAYRCITENL